MNFSNISFVQQTSVNSSILQLCLILFFVCIYFFAFSVCTLYAFRDEVHFLFCFECVCNPLVLPSVQLQKVSVTLSFRRLQCLVLRSVLSVFIKLRSVECVCVHTMDFVSAHKQIN